MTPSIDRRKLLRRAERLLKFLELPDRELSILLCGDEEIRELNRVYRNKDRPTDVLSFAQQEGPAGHLHPEILGDVVISLPTAHRQAERREVALMEEVLFLLVHGVLHLLGHEHVGVSSSVGRAMRKEQNRLLALLQASFRS